MGENGRLRKEMIDCGKDFDVSGVFAEPIDGDLTHLLGKIKGPKDTPYEGGIFFVDIRIPREYPFAPPKMKFNNQIWHPNISSQTGAICLDILKDAWSPALTIKTALLSLQALLSAPEPNDPQDAEVAGQYKRDRATWAKTAKFWTEMYASSRPGASSSSSTVGGTTAAEEEALLTMHAMGFEREPSLRALRAKKGNVEQAIEMLIASA
jgi:ubiquitin-conjugating enzyme (huntingtin interacting protein 2)